MLARYLDTGQEYNNTKEQMGLDIDRIFIDAGTLRLMPLLKSSQTEFPQQWEIVPLLRELSCTSLGR
jgi:hypothetical protein